VLSDLVEKPLLHKVNSYRQMTTMIGTRFLGPTGRSLLFAVAVAPVRDGTPAPTSMRTAIADGLCWLAGAGYFCTPEVLLGINTFCHQFGFGTLVLHLDPAASGCAVVDDCGRPRQYQDRRGSRGSVTAGVLAGGTGYLFGLRAPYPVAGVLHGRALLVAIPVPHRANWERSQNRLQV
jgi:hypothetical protein